ncbi:MAG: flagellar basal body rod protein FlgB [Candidatus Kryptoniota bacterium]
MKISFFDRSRIPLLEKALDAYSLRNKIIANNIANIETPNYRRADVTFEKELNQALDQSDNDVSLSNSVKRVEPQIEIDRSAVLTSGANNVDIDEEMAELAKNQLRFQMAARLMSQTFQLIDRSITGGGTQ